MEYFFGGHWVSALIQQSRQPDRERETPHLPRLDEESRACRPEGYLAPDEHHAASEQPPHGAEAGSGRCGESLSAVLECRRRMARCWSKPHCGHQLVAGWRCDDKQEQTWCNLHSASCYKHINRSGIKIKTSQHPPAARRANIPSPRNYPTPRTSCPQATPGIQNPDQSRPRPPIPRSENLFRRFSPSAGRSLHSETATPEEQ